MHRTDVSDSHPVTVQPICPPQPMAVKATCPRPARCTVNDANPDASRMMSLRDTALRLPTSAENVSDMILDRCITITCARHVSRALCHGLHRIDVSHSHSVPSHPVYPPRPMAVKATSFRRAALLLAYCHRHPIDVLSSVSHQASHQRLRLPLGPMGTMSEPALHPWERCRVQPCTAQCHRHYSCSCPVVCLCEAQPPRVHRVDG